MSSSLVPEKPLLVYPSLAATLGLEESIMLCALSEISQQHEVYSRAQESSGFLWFQVALETLLQQLPFWNQRDLQRISTNLRDKGVLITSSASLEQSNELRFAFNEKVQQRLAQTNPTPLNSTKQPASQRMPVDPRSLRRDKSTQPRPSFGDGGFLSKNYISPQWQPDETTLAQLSQHGMPSSFALQQVPEFITYWRDRGEAHHSWNAKFIKHALRGWRNFEQERHQQEQQAPIQGNWKPSHDALEILIEKGGIKREFVEDAVPEFILYWRERGESHRTWNTKFVQHVRVQWAKYTAAIEHNTDPRPIPESWQPSADVYDVLRLANIDLAFARSFIAEFVLYWRDRGTLHGSWNTKFLQHVKYRWAQRHVTADTSSQRQTRDISLEEQLTDRSWAD